ncbi:MAG: DUF6744 family protein [Oscillospiraceae bacterium]
METICTNYLRALEATKLSITGHMYFVPGTYMDRDRHFRGFYHASQQAQQKGNAAGRQQLLYH